MIIEGTIKRQIAAATNYVNREVEIPFLINTEDGTYSQWGHDTLVLGENVDLLEALRDAACDHTEPEVETCRDCGRVTRVDDEPVDTDAADGEDGCCGSCADRRYNAGEDTDG